MNQRLKEMDVQFIDTVDGVKDFSGVKQGEVVILPAFGASVQVGAAAGGGIMRCRRRAGGCSGWVGHHAVQGARRWRQQLGCQARSGRLLGCGFCGAGFSTVSCSPCAVCWVLPWIPVLPFCWGCGSCALRTLPELWVLPLFLPFFLFFVGAAGDEAAE